MKLTDILNSGPDRKARKRVGRGRGNGLGKTCGRGTKGAASRSGFSRRPSYDGGQIPLVRRLPKRGFTNALFTSRFDVVNVGQLDAHFQEGESVNSAAVEKRLGLKFCCGSLKVLGGGELKKKLVLTVAAISESGRKKVEAAGGTIQLTRIPKVKRKKKPAARPAPTAKPAPKAAAAAGAPTESAKPEKPDKKSDKAQKPDKAGKAEKSEKSEKSEKAEKKGKK